MNDREHVAARVAAPSPPPPISQCIRPLASSLDVTIMHTSDMQGVMVIVADSQLWLLLLLLLLQQRLLLLADDECHLLYRGNERIAIGVTC